MRQPVYICGASRTPIGKFRGSLASVSAPDLGAHVIGAALQRSQAPSDAVDECWMGCALTGGLGQAPARQAWLGAGGDESVPCTTVGKVCGSGMQAVVAAARALALDEHRVAVAGGMENMSISATLYPDSPASPERPVSVMVVDGLWDVYTDKHMGTLCDELARAEGIERAEQDDYAMRSYERAIAATRTGAFADEIAPIATPEGSLAEDESIWQYDPDKVRTIGPVFDKENGTITAANASSLNDGAAALVLASQRGVDDLGLTPKARIVAWSAAATAPDHFPVAPALAIQKLLSTTGMEPSQVDYWEINEAFAAAVLLVQRRLHLPDDRLNPFGGAVALGHPIGASGARILTTLLNVLEKKNARRGVAALCIGGGEATAMMVERV